MPGMLTAARLAELLARPESERLERKRSIGDRDALCKVVCALSNDLGATADPGYLLIGVEDDGTPSGLTVTDVMLTTLVGQLRDDAHILPMPSVSIDYGPLPEGRGDVIVVEVAPSNAPPVRYRGRIHVRVGPRQAEANEQDERRLTERRTAQARTFDGQPCRTSGLDDLRLDVFEHTYLPTAVAPEVIAENHRPIEAQLASLRLYDLAQACPTHAGVLLLGKNPSAHLAGAYLHFVRYAGNSRADEVRNEREIRGCLVDLLPQLDALLGAEVNTWPASVGTLREQDVADYPAVALREVLMNALVHRSYESNTPARLDWFAGRVEIQSPGGLYGEVTTTNFDRQTAYRNPVLAEALKNLGYVNRFGRGIARVHRALEQNGSPAARFDFEAQSATVTLERRP